MTVLAAGLAAGTGAVAADWPQFRGPNRDGKSAETGLLKEWPAEGPPLAWRIDGLGKGYSSVAIAGDRIYTMGDRDKSQFVIALDRKTRREAWATRAGNEWRDGGARSTPTVDGDRVYAISAHGDMVCLAVADGREIWRKNYAKDFGGKMMSGWGCSESPLVDGDRLICTPGGRDAAIVALDKKSGDVIWKARVPDLGPDGLDGAGYASVVVSQACGIRQYVQLLGRGVVGVAAKDGRFLWGYNRIANKHANIATPIVHGDFVFCSTSYETGSAFLRLVPAKNGGIDCNEVYFLDQRDFQNHHGGVVLVDGHLYGGHGRNQGFPTCIEMKTGRILWKDRGPGNRSAAVAYADGNLYFRYEEGTVALIEATPKALRVASTFKLPTTRNGPSWPYPAILDGHLYLRHGDALLCYDIRNTQSKSRL